jgi:hypothetical protein
MEANMGKSYRIPTYYSDDLKEAEEYPDDIAVRRFIVYKKDAPPCLMYQLIRKYTDHKGNERTKKIAGMSGVFAEFIKNSPKLDAMQTMMVNAHQGRD